VHDQKVFDGRTPARDAGMNRGVERRLAAIVSADIVSYTRLMRADEEGTLTRLRGLRSELVDPRIADFKGRIVKELGDGLLIEFSSVVDAVRCAIEIQRAMKQQAETPEDQRIVYRIGINLGDVIVDGDDIQGDGVNIATRMQEVAPPGGISVSGIVFDSVQGKLAPHFEDLGPQQVKNVEEPVRAYRVMIDPEAERGTGAASAGAGLRSDAAFNVHTPQGGSGPQASAEDSGPRRAAGGSSGARTGHIPDADGHGRTGRIVSLLTGARRVGTWSVPRRLKVASVMAAIDLDFTQAEFESSVAEVDIAAVMGAVKVTVPPDIRVECDGVGLLGVFESLQQSGRNLPPDAPTLRITGAAIMGALEIAGAE